MEKNRRRLATLFTVCFFAVLIIAAKQYLPGIPFFQTPSLMPFRDADVSKIILNGAARNQTLVKKQDVWVVPVQGVNYQADTDKVNNLLKTLHALKADTVVSRNKSKFADFGIGKANIVLEAGKKTYTLFVGTASLGDDAYARLEGQDTVFDAANLGTIFMDTDFRNLHIPVIGNTVDVQSVKIDYEGEKTVLTQSGNTWHNGADAPVSDTVVDSYLQDMANLQASDIKEAKNLPQREVRLTVTVTEKGKEKTVRFYSVNGQNIEAEVTGSPYLYTLPQVYVAALEKKDSDFIGPTTQP